MGELQEANQYADDMYDKYLNAKMRAKNLEFGPGGIMDMKQTIADKEAMIYSLESTIADKEAMIYALESQIGLMKNYAESEKN